MESAREAESTSDGGADSSVVGGGGRGGSSTVSQQLVIANSYSSGIEEDIYSFQWNIENFDFIRNHEKLIKSQEIFVTTDANIRWKFHLSIARDLLRQEYIGVYRKLLSTPGGHMEVFNAMSLEINSNEFTQGKAMTMKTNGKCFGYDHVIPRNEKTETLNLVNGALVIKVTMKTYFDLATTGKKRKSTESFEDQSVKKLRDDLSALLDGHDTTADAKPCITDTSETERFSDIKIVSKDGVEFAAHKAILAARNPVFKAMLQSNLLEAQTGVVEISDVSGAVLKIILNFIYTGTLANEWNQPEILEEFAQAIDKYQLTDCMEFLDETLGELCTPKTVADLLHLSERLSLKKAEADCMIYLRRYCFSKAKNYGDFAKVFGENDNNE